MLKMASQIETIVNTYKTLSKIPSIAGGKLNRAGNKVTVNWSVRNLDKGKNTKYTTNYNLDENLNVIAQSDFGVDISNELLTAISPKETYKAVIREEKNSKDVKKQYLEVWSKSTLAHSIDLTALDLHGDVYADSEFGNIDWNQDETKIVYVAERKQPKYEPFIKRKGEVKPKSDECGSGDPAPNKGEEFIYREDWGEQLVGKRSSVIVVCSLPDETVAVHDRLPQGWCPGQVRFTPAGDSVVGVAWPTEPRRLGLIFCTNRPSFIFSLALDGDMTTLSKEGHAVRSPRFGPNGELVWLQRVADGPHHACHQLVIKKTNSDEAVPLIDIVQVESQTVNGHPFYGVFCQALPKNCFTGDGRLVFSTPQKNETRTFVVDLGLSSIADISILSDPGSTSVLDVRNDVIIASYSNLTTPGQLYAARLPAKGRESDIKWVRVSETSTPSPVTGSVVEYLQLEHEGSSDNVKSFSAIYFAPKTEEGKKLPLIVWPHGGPHSNFVNAYALETSLFNMLGFAAVLINYRGSTGAGQETIDYLPRHVGDSDVKDCKLATDVAVTKFNANDRQMVLFGGSHGGFLVTHLNGQYPDVFKAMVSRNPVTDVATMFNYTDINDWCAVEAGFPFTEAGPISEEELLTLRRCSPLVHVHRARAPSALMLGSGDKRVPYYQGLEYARRLKANGVETRVYMYDDNHSLSSLPVEMDNLINSANWFLTHLQN